METKYVVVDGEGEVSMSAENDAESFTTFRAAEKRAKALARTFPGKAIGIYELVGVAVCPVKEVESARKYPLEHYR